LIAGFNSLPDAAIQARIEKRLDRVRLGNLRDYRSISKGVCELRIHTRKGYRVYFGQLGATVVLLLCGGDNGTQKQDIRQAIEYWKAYRSESDA